MTVSDGGNAVTDGGIGDERQDVIVVVLVTDGAAVRWCSLLIEVMVVMMVTHECDAGL